MYQRLRGTEYSLDIDPDKILKVEKVFKDCLSKYFMPPESMQVSPEIIFSPMPGGALTANTQMMRDNNCLDKYDACIAEMREVVAKGGFGTSVTPVSQFYFQQAFRNAVMGKNADGSWKLDPKGYGLMVLGYFGKTPIAPDPQVVKWAQEQLGKEPTTKAVVEINDANPELGITAATKTLEANNLPVTDENIFIIAACGDKGLKFLQGDKPMGIRYNDEKPAAGAAKADNKSYTATVDGKTFNVQVVSDDTVTVDGKTFKVGIGTGAAAAAPKAAGSGNAKEITSPLPGTVLRICVSAGDAVEAGDELMILEAMKMETPVKAEAAGTVADILVNEKDVVTAGQALLSIEEK